MNAALYQQFADEQREHLNRIPPEKRKEHRVEMLNRVFAKCPTDARPSVEANSAMFWAPGRLEGDARNRAIELVKNGIPATTVLNVIEGKSPGLQLVADESKQTQYSADDWRQHRMRVNSVNGAFKAADRVARKKQEERNETTRRFASIAADLDSPEFLLREHKSARHEAAHGAVAIGCGCEIESMESRPHGGGGRTVVLWSERTTQWQKIATLMAGPAMTGPTARTAMNQQSTDAAQLLSELRSYFWIGDEPTVQDMLAAPVLSAVEAEVKTYLAVHSAIIEAFAVTLARAGRIDLETNPCIVDILDDLEKKLAPFPPHPQNWAVAQHRDNLLQSNIRCARGEVERECAEAAYEAEKFALGTACSRYYAKTLSSMGA
jgi:hypothetical protein